MNDGGRVEIDTAALERFMRRLAAGMDQGGDTAARTQANTTANAIRPNVPRRTGRLQSTVRVAQDGDGWAVKYGGGLKYAAPMEKRSHAVSRGVEGADRQFQRACLAMATHEAGVA